MADSVSPVGAGPGVFAGRPVSPRAAPGFFGARPDVTVQAQEALQARRLSTQLLSTLMTRDGRLLKPPQWPPAPVGPSPLQASHAADSLGTLRAAEDIIQAASAGPPTAEGRRIAAEAFMMEAQAQRDFVMQQAQEMSGRRQWLA
ncbi:MAG TPA: hypothetical protein VFI08_08960 [Spirochaetia bacterium]|nr:hypothetical protein [Spirochaetia bacterium]